MGIFDIILAGLILCVAGIAQSAVGFGYALFATPLLLWIGIPLPDTITLVATCSMGQAIISARKLREHVPWKLSLTATAVRVASVLIGLFLLKQLVTLDTSYIRLTIGCILCLLTIIQLVWKTKTVQALHWGWAGLAFFSSGILAGICGMGGPPLVLWAMAQDWSTKKTRGFLFAVFATAIPIQLILLTITFGTSILKDIAIGVAFIPLTFVNTAIGLPIGNRWPKKKLKRIAYATLLIIGVSAIVPSILNLIN